MTGWPPEALLGARIGLGLAALGRPAYEDEIHDFVILNATRETNGAEAAIADAIRFLRRALDQTG